MHLDLAALDRHLGHLGEVGAVALHHRDAQLVPGRQRFAPARFLDRQLQHTQILRLLGQQRAPVVDRVFAGGGRQLIDERLVGERIDAVRDRAPEAGRHGGVLDEHAGELVRDVVGRRCRLEHERIDAVLDERGEQPLRHRRAGVRVLHRHRLARCVEPGGQFDVADRAVVVVRHVVFARPDQLDRHAGGLGDFDRLAHEVDLDAATEAAAQEGGAHLDLLGLHVQHAGDHPLRQLLKLGRAGQGARVGFDIGDEVHRLHRHVGRKRDLVAGLHGLGSRLQRRLGIADLLEVRHAGLVDGLFQIGGDGGGVELRSGRFVPLDGDCCQRGFGLPVGVCDHGDAVADLHHVFDAGHRLRLGRVEAHHLAAERRALRQCGDQHAGHLGVDAELGRTVDLGRRVEPRHALADVAEVFGRLQRRLFRRRQLRRGFGQLTVAGFLAGGAGDPGVLRLAG